MRVIGTAGHVDHGKSTLIAALTGTHPDRLKEEQQREMTIELGFGWLTLADGEEVGIVDVPGHRDFIENMLAGVGGIDAALLVIAADEGVMPQTREHLAILDLLQIPAGIIVITKIDLVPDPAWLDLVESDIRAVVGGTVMGEAPIVRVSARTKAGLEALVSGLGWILRQEPPRTDLGRPRLPIDRVFSMSGFGTVVTGTLLDGQLAPGDEVEILPSGHKGRVRGLQTHGKKEERAMPGSRTAVNISGIEAESIRRGEVLVRPGQYQPTRRLDARLHLLPGVSAAVRHNTEVKFFVGASETIASLRLLGREELGPGEEGWIQLELREPVVTVRGDRYILRRPSPGETLGGGVIVDPRPGERHRRFDENVLRSLESLAQGTPANILLEAALALNIATVREVVARAHLGASDAEAGLRELMLTRSLIALEEGTPHSTGDLLVMAAPHWDSLQAKVLQIVGDYHRSYPLRGGIPREELKSKLKLSARAFNSLITNYLSQNLLKDSGTSLALPAHEARFDPGQQATVQGLLRRFEQDPSAPPAMKELQQEVGEELVNALIESSRLVAVSPEIVFRREDYDRMVRGIRDHLRQNGKVTLGEVRDMFGTSRKYAQALLEHLDAIGLTLRDRDFRTLRKK